MYGISIREQKTGATDVIAGALRALRDLRPLGEQVAEVMRRDNADGVRAGTDWLGKPLAEIADSTRRKRERDGKGAGPPLAPDDLGSRVATRYEVEVNQVRSWQVMVVGSWPTLYWLKYHTSQEPRTHLPLRDIVGTRPGPREEIHDLIWRYIVGAGR